MYPISYTGVTIGINVFRAPVWGAGPVTLSIHTYSRDVSIELKKLYPETPNSTRLHTLQCFLKELQFSYSSGGT